MVGGLPLTFQGSLRGCSSGKPCAPPPLCPSSSRPTKPETTVTFPALLGRQQAPHKLPTQPHPQRAGRSWKVPSAHGLPSEVLPWASLEVTVPPFALRSAPEQRPRSVGSPNLAARGTGYLQDECVAMETTYGECRCLLWWHPSLLSRQITPEFLSPGACHPIITWTARAPGTGRWTAPPVFSFINPFSR